MSVSRRQFLKDSATLATVAAINPQLTPATPTPAKTESDPQSGLTFTRTANSIHITMPNGIALDFLLENNHVKGISTVTLHGKPLRNPSQQIWPEIATPYGEEASYYELVDVTAKDGAVIISTRPYFRVGHRMTFTEHALHPLISTAPWSSDPVSPEGTSLDWVLHEVNETYDDVPYSGFSYGFRYRAPQHPIYQLEDKATWELGGNIVGNGFIMRGANAPHTKFSGDTILYSGWYFPGIANPHVFQHKPLYTQMQGFTFQYDAEQVLLTVHEKPSHVRALYQRTGEQPFLLHFNQFCFDLTTTIDTPPRKILVGARKGKSEAALANQYLRVRDFLQDQHRKHYGLRYDRSRPSAHVETWAIVNMKSFLPIFEQLKKWGVNRTFIMPLWRSAETDINPRFKDDRKRFGVFGNMCTMLELEIADVYGGWDGFRSLMDQAKSLHLETYMWFGTHFSSMSPLGEQIPEFYCREQSGQYNHNNYGHVLFAVNQRNPKYQEYALASYKRLNDCGLTGLFHDSHFNLATDTINFLHDSKPVSFSPYKPAPFQTPADLKKLDTIISMHDTSLSLQKQIQTGIGMVYYVESEGALGTPMCGTDYENTRGNEYIYSNMESGLDTDRVKAFGDDFTTAYFRAMAARLMFAPEINPDTYPDPKSITPWWDPETMPPLNHAFNRVENDLQEMWVLEDNRGILWTGPAGKVIFAYKDFSYPLESPVTIYDAHTEKRFLAKTSLEAKKFGIYRLEN